MNLRRSLAAGTLALTTVVVAGPLAANASAQTDTTSPPVAQNLNCRRIVKQVRNVTRRLGRAQLRLAFWQKVAAEMPARIEAQQAVVADLQAQVAAATPETVADLQTQLDRASEKLAWMQSKLEASGRRIPVWTDAVARLTALQAALGEQATAGECPLPSTTTTTVETDDSPDGSTTSTVPGAARADEQDEDEGDDDGPSSTVEDRTAAERLAEAQRKNAERLAEAQRKNAERLAEAQKRAAESQRRTRESERRSRTSTSAPTPTVEDRRGDSGSEQDDD